MNKELFTQGDWVVFQVSESNDTSHIGVSIASGLAGDIAHCHGFDSTRTDTEELANATLIAAAPKLLKAAQRSLNWLSSYPGGCCNETYEEMRAAIDLALKLPESNRSEENED